MEATIPQEGFDIQNLLYILAVIIAYTLMIFFRVQGISKKLLMSVVEKIENKAKTDNPVLLKIMQQLKFEIAQDIDNKGLTDDMNNILSKVDPKHKENKFVRFLKTIFKIAVFLK